MKNRICLYGAMVLLLLSSCKKSYVAGNSEQYSRLYIPQAVNIAEYAYTVTEGEHTIEFSAAYGGWSLPEKDIRVEFAIDNSKVADYNTKNGTGYKAMPSGTYLLQTTSATIQKGNSSSALLKIIVTPNDILKANEEYLLPVSIVSNNENIEINEDLRTCYFLIKGVRGVYEDFDKSLWTIAGYSSSEATEGGNRDIAGGGGPAAYAIDGNINTFWSTPWGTYVTTYPAPHYIAIDMGEVKNIHGFHIAPRQNSHGLGNPRFISIEVSNDNSTWEHVEDFELPNIRPQGLTSSTIYLENTVSAKYFKVIVNESHRSTPTNYVFTYIAEISAF